MKFFFNMGEGTPFPLDILCKNLVNFYKFSRFISEKINSFYQNMFQLMFEKNNFNGSFLVKTGGVLMLHLELWMIGADDQGTQYGSKHHYWSFGATFVLQTFLYLGSFLVKTGGVLMLHLEL